jgi:hypothetical protein
MRASVLRKKAPVSKVKNLALESVAERVRTKLSPEHQPLLELPTLDGVLLRLVNVTEAWVQRTVTVVTNR